MDFTQLNSWLEKLRPVLKSSQADFLVKELYALNARTNRAQDAKLDDLVEEIRKENETNLKLLKPGLQLNGSVIDEYAPALEYMNLTPVRQGSLGFDEHIAIVRRAAQELLQDNENWLVKGRGGSLTIWYLPFQDALNQDFQTRNAIYLDCWIDRSKNHLEIAVYSNKHKLPAEIDQKAMRKSLVKELRGLCDETGLSTLAPCTGETFQVTHIDLPRGSTTSDSAKEQLSNLHPLASQIDNWLRDGFVKWKEKYLS